MRKKGNYFLLFLTVLFLTACGTALYTQENTQTEASAAEAPAQTEVESDPFEYDGPIQIHREAGVVESLFHYEKNRQYAIHYPSFGRDNIDRVITEQITDWEQAYLRRQIEHSRDTEAEAELNIEFSTYRTGDLVTLVYRITETASWQANPEERWKTFYFDLKEDKEVSLRELLPQEKLNEIALFTDQYFKTDAAWKNVLRMDSYEENVRATYENYQNLVIKKDGLRVIFEEYDLYAGSNGAPFVDLAGEHWRDFVRIPENPVTETAAKPVTLETEPSAATEVQEMTEETQAPVPEETEAPPMPETAEGEAGLIALTYDDGPTAENTYRILAALRQADARATFFMVGNRVESYPEVAAAVLAQGSEIGNHSYSHPDLTTLNASDLAAQFALTDKAIQDAAGITPVLVRVPYGALDSDVTAAAGRPLIQWSVDTLDWKTRDAQTTVSTVLEQVADGDIILMHDLHEATAEASEILIPELAKRGFRMVTVSELLQARTGAAKAGQVVYSIR